jgi:hypothetical protein
MIVVLGCMLMLLFLRHKMCVYIYIVKKCEKEKGLTNKAN